MACTSVTHSRSETGAFVVSAYRRSPRTLVGSSRRSGTGWLSESTIRVSSSVTSAVKTDRHSRCCCPLSATYSNKRQRIVLGLGLARLQRGGENLLRLLHVIEGVETKDDRIRLPVQLLH